uniref:UvrD-like helicase, ATP-binding domain, P-loop containing nucleoside triphosphate hydrolase n=1 Tax=Tanacetum cinerariifolium TaxID=118510 RepID=A0A699H1R3_TANCI|nr:UvrD-like helicase, ATP-binding domain, P-loop containing nucleoside triphosphate hydrolase [Tanacetum cinerariifolium]
MGMPLMAIFLIEDRKHEKEEAKKSFQSNLGIGTWFSQIQQAFYDFIFDGRVTWVKIKGIPLKMWSENTFSHVASKWGVLLYVDDQEDMCFHRKRICINANVMSNIFESFKVIYRGKVFWVRAKDVPGWVLDFMEDNEEENDSDDGIYEGELNERDLKNEKDLERDSYVEVVHDAKLEEEPHKLNMEEASEDVVFGEKKADSKNKSKNDEKESICSGHFKKFEIPRPGSFILQLMDDLVKVGQTMGYNMEGCMKNMKEIIESQRLNEVHR